MKNLFNARWPLLLTLLIFIVLKFNHLFVNFFWDESWPYASGVYQMYLHGPSLLPGSIDGEVSRGHPLFFHFLGAIWMKLFGTSKFALHSFALSISLAYLIAIYEAAYRLFNRNIAITALLLCAFQLIFFVQSAFVLPEILVALLGFVSLYFYVTKKYFITAATLTMLMYTKESGCVLTLILGIDAFIRLFNKNILLKERLQAFFAVVVPVLLIGCFFLLQKMINGWYVLPLYTNGLEATWNNYYHKMREGSKFLFRNDYRKYFFLFVAALSFITAIKDRKGIYGIFTLAGVIIFMMVSDDYHYRLPNYITFSLFIIALFAAYYYCNRITGFNGVYQKRFMFLGGFFTVLFLAFSAYNMFFIFRYMLIILMLILLVTSVYYHYFVSRISKHLFIPSLAILLFIEFYAYKHTPGIGDSQLGAFEGIYVHEQIVKYMVDHKLQDKKISTGGFLERIHLTDPYSGYVSPTDTFGHVQWEIMPLTDYVIFDNIETDYRHPFVKENTQGYTLVYRVTKGEAWGEIYSQKHQ